MQERSREPDSTKENSAEGRFEKLRLVKSRTSRRFRGFLFRKEEGDDGLYLELFYVGRGLGRYLLTRRRPMKTEANSVHDY